MSVLTWRNVDAPQGGGAVQGLATAGNLLSHSADGLASAIGQFGNAQTTIAGDAAAQAASRYQTADGLRSALADGSLLNGLRNLGIDPTDVNAASIGSLQKGVDDRISNDLHSAQTTAAGLKGQYDAARAGKSAFDLAVSQRDQSALTAIMPYTNRIQTLRDAGQNDAANALINSPEFQQLSLNVDPDTLGKIMRGSQTAYSNTLDAMGKVTSNQKAAQDQAASLQADQVLQLMNRHPATDAQGMSDFVSGLGLSPQAEALARQRWNASNKDYQLAAGPTGSNGVMTGGGTPSGAGGAPSANVSDFVAKYTPAAQQAADALGTDVNTVLGQWALETGNGQHMAAPNNLGNIKQFDGGGVAATDNALGTVSKYRQYDTPEAFAQDYVANIKKNWAGSVGAGADTAKFAAGLRSGQQGGYAQDTNYANKLIRMAATVGNVRNQPALAATSASLAPGEQDVTQAPEAAPANGASAAIAKATELPGIDDLVANSSQSASINSALQAGSVQRDGQNIANTGIKASNYLAAMQDGSSTDQIAQKLTAKGAQFEGENPSTIGRYIDDIKQKAVQRGESNKAVAKLTSAAAAQILTSGDGVIKPGDAGTKYLPWRMIGGRYYDDTAADNLLGSINAGGITKAMGITTENQQAQSVATNAQKALDDVTQQVMAVRKAEEQGYASDPAYQRRLAAKYAAAKDRRDKAWEKLNAPNSQQLNTSPAAAKQDAAATALTAEDARRQALLDAMGDPLNQPAYAGQF